MRADTHDGPEQMLHLEAEYIVAALTFVDLKRHLAPRGRAIHMARVVLGTDMAPAANGRFWLCVRRRVRQLI